MSTDVQIIDNSAIAESADSLLSQAIKAGASIDTLERLMALRKEMQAEKAKEAFNFAMAAFQAECPVIEKTKGVKTKSGAVAYKYAPIDSIVDQVKVFIQKHGFRYSTTIEFEGSLVKAICRVVHTLGHEEISIMPVPLGNKTDIMSQTQVVAAASTFAKRYAFLNAFGIMTGDEDNDAKDMSKAPAKPITKKPVVDAKVQKKEEVVLLASAYQLDEIKNLCKELGKPVNETKLLKLNSSQAEASIALLKKEAREVQELRDASIQADSEQETQEKNKDDGFSANLTYTDTLN